MERVDWVARGGGRWPARVCRGSLEDAARPPAPVQRQPLPRDRPSAPTPALQPAGNRSPPAPTALLPAHDRPVVPVGSLLSREIVPPAPGEYADGSAGLRS